MTTEAICFKNDPPSTRSECRSAGRDANRRAYILIEVLMAMTILALAGTVLIRALTQAVNATSMVRDVSKSIYLTKLKLHEIELAYSRRDNVELGEFSDRFRQPGAEKYRWHALIEYDRDRDAYIITVQTTWDEENTRQARRRRRWSSRRRGGDSNAFQLKSMVMTARYNESLPLGMSVDKRQRGQGRYQGGGRRR